MGVYGLYLWLPQIVKGFGLSNDAVGFVTACPFFAAIVAQVYWARHSDRVNERTWHVAGACFLSGAGLALSAWLGGEPLWALVALVAAAMGLFFSSVHLLDVTHCFHGGKWSRYRDRYY